MELALNAKRRTENPDAFVSRFQSQPAGATDELLPGNGGIRDLRATKSRQRVFTVDHVKQPDETLKDKASYRAEAVPELAEP